MVCYRVIHAFEIQKVEQNKGFWEIWVGLRGSIIKFYHLCLNESLVYVHLA